MDIAFLASTHHFPKGVLSYGDAEMVKTESALREVIVSWRKLRQEHIIIIQQVG